jgi:hypothetical protein
MANSYKRLSPEQFRKLIGNTNISDEDALKKIESIEKFSIIMYELYMKYKKEERLHDVLPSKNE